MEKALPALVGGKGVFLIEDAFEFLRRVPDESIDFVNTDPPYPSLELHRAIGTTTRLKESEGSSNPWFHVITWDDFPVLLSEFYRVLKPNSAFFLWCDETTADVVKACEGISDPRSSRMKNGGRACKSGFVYWREWIWAKASKDGTKLVGGMGYHGRGAHERLMFFLKGKRKAAEDVLDVLVAPEGTSDDLMFAARPPFDGPTPKPPEIAEKLVRAYTKPGDIILDTFAGTGVLGEAALVQDRRFIMVDIDDKWALPTMKPFVQAPRIAMTPLV